MEHKHRADQNAHHAKPYARLALMAGLSFLAMFALMYAMVDRFAHIYPNLNQAYMALLMAAPMVAIEIALISQQAHQCADLGRQRPRPGGSFRRHSHTGRYRR